APYRPEDLLGCLRNDALGFLCEVELEGDLLLAKLLGVGVLGDAVELDDVVAVLRLDDTAQLAGLQGERGILERLDHTALRYAAEVATLPGRRFVAHVARHVTKVFAALDALQGRLDALLRRSLACLRIASLRELCEHVPDHAALRQELRLAVLPYFVDVVL